MLLAALLSAAALGVVFLAAQRQLDRPFQGYSDKHLHVTVPRGYGVNQIGRLLEDRGVISSSRIFSWYLRIAATDQSLKAGDYLFENPMSIRDVIAKLQRGEVYRFKITVPEGLDRLEIVSLLARRGLGDGRKLRSAVENPALIQDLDPLADTLEGYLLPETYWLTRVVDEDALVAAMVTEFRRIWTPERRLRAQQLGLGLRQVVTLASLIEKETALAEERRLVSSVFHNRLRRNMKLDCDPTVIYAVKQVKPFDGIIHRSDLQLDSPYNTYLYPGLPPGPIANPGLASIEAALAPEETSFLYFVSRNDGSHIFSTNYRDHQRAVVEYQR